MEDDDDIPIFGGPTELLPFEAWSDLSAQLLGRDSVTRANTLEKAKVEARDFEASGVHWGQAIAEDLSRGDFTRASVYGGKCSEEMQRRRSEGDAAPPLTLVQWVALEEDIAKRPNDLLELLPAHGVADLNAFAEAKRSWQARLSADKDLAAEYEALRKPRVP